MALGKDKPRWVCILSYKLISLYLLFNDYFEFDPYGDNCLLLCSLPCHYHYRKAQATK